MGATCCKAKAKAASEKLGSSVAVARQSPSWRIETEEEELGVEVVQTVSSSSSGASQVRKEEEEEEEELFLAKPKPKSDQSLVSSSSSSEIKEPSNTSTSTPRAGPAPSDPKPSKRTRCSPGYTLYREVSDSRISSLKSSFNSLHSLSNNSSDGWSQREMGASFNSSTLMTTTPSPDSQSCKICSRVLKERSPFSTQKIVSSTRENPVIAVLPCGHVYHGDCLDNITIEMDKFEPNCPACNFGDKFGTKFSGKIRVSRNAVVDLDIDAGSYHKPGNHKGKGPKRSFSRPFLKRHFSIGSSRPEVERKRGWLISS